MASTSFSKRHPVATVLLVLLVLLVLGAGGTYVATDQGKDLLPTIENVRMNTGNITPDSLKAQMRVQLQNHVPLTLTVDSFRYVAYLDSTAMSRGAKDEPTTMQGRGTSTVAIPVNLDLSKVAQQVKASQRDCVTVTMTMDLYTHLPLLGTKRIPVRVDKRVYIPKLPKIEVADVDITHLGLQDGEATIQLRVTNYNPFAFTIKRVAYDFRISDDMQVKGVETKEVTFRKRGTQLMPIKVHFQPKSTPKVAFKALFRAKKTTYQLTGTVTVNAGKEHPKDSEIQFRSTGTLKDLKDIAK